jgi:hypothetical protein
MNAGPRESGDVTQVSLSIRINQKQDAHECGANKGTKAEITPWITLKHTTAHS